MPSNLMAIEFFERFASWLPSSYAREDGYSSNLTRCVLRFNRKSTRPRSSGDALYPTRRNEKVGRSNTQSAYRGLARYFAAGILSRAENSTHLDRERFLPAWPAADLAADGSAGFVVIAPTKEFCKCMILRGKFSFDPGRS
jgi:hypothetical protein